jgi:hypothetical protein
VARFVSLFDAQTLDHRTETAALNELAESVGWIVLHAGDSIRLDKNSRAIVISGVTWSKPDLEVLDELATRDIGGTRVCSSTQIMFSRMNGFCLAHREWFRPRR